jgi:hypothetical protein
MILSAAATLVLMQLAAPAPAGCPTGFQPYGGRCVSQPMADYISCLEAAGGNQATAKTELDKQLAGQVAGGAQGSGQGAIIKGAGSLTLSRGTEQKIVEKVDKQWFAGGGSDCLKAFELQLRAKLTPAVRKDPPPVKKAPNDEAWLTSVTVKFQTLGDRKHADEPIIISVLKDDLVLGDTIVGQGEWWQAYQDVRPLTVSLSHAPKREDCKSLRLRVEKRPVNSPGGNPWSMTIEAWGKEKGGTDRVLLRRTGRIQMGDGRANELSWIFDCTPGT